MLENPTISKTQFPIESLLSARLLLEPQIVGDRIYFLSDLAGTLSLYSIASSGSIPEPLLPGGLALVNPHIMHGEQNIQANPTAPEAKKTPTTSRNISRRTPRSHKTTDKKKTPPPTSPE